MILLKHWNIIVDAPGRLFDDVGDGLFGLFVDEGNLTLRDLLQSHSATLEARRFVVPVDAFGVQQVVFVGCFLAHHFFVGIVGTSQHRERVACCILLPPDEVVHHFGAAWNHEYTSIEHRRRVRRRVSFVEHRCIGTPFFIEVPKPVTLMTPSEKDEFIEVILKALEGK